MTSSAPTTLNTETELSAVNSILGAIGQSPVTTLGSYTEISGETTYTGNNSTTTYAIGITYTESSEIKATLDGVATTLFTISGSNLTFTSAPGTNVAIKIYREVEKYNTLANPEVSFIYNLLRESNTDVQNEGWIFNRESNVVFSPDANTKYITIPTNVLRLDVSDGYKKTLVDPIRKNGRLYDRIAHTDLWDGDIKCDVVYNYTFEDIPSVFQRYITLKAAGRAATQLIANADLVKLLANQEATARAACMEYECNQGNHTIFGFPDESTYTAYQPWRVLAR